MVIYKQIVGKETKFKPYIFFSLLFYEDQKNLEEEISRLRKDLKPKVSKLHELEGL